MDSLPDENAYRFIAVLNKKVEIGKLLNALGHMTAGLAGKIVNAEDMHFLHYRDADGGSHDGISHFPFIVVKADGPAQIRKVRSLALEQGIAFTDFTSTMTVGTSTEQLQQTAATSESDLEYYGICLFGETTRLRELTGKFSLFR